MGYQSGIAPKPIPENQAIFGLDLISGTFLFFLQSCDRRMIQCGENIRAVSLQRLYLKDFLSISQNQVLFDDW
jgi:hypothetical protein